MKVSKETVYFTPGYSYCYQRLLGRRLHYNLHTHRELELLVISSGTVEAQIGDYVETFKAPAAFFIGTNLAHGIASNGEVQGMILQIPQKYISHYRLWPEAKKLVSLCEDSQKGIIFSPLFSKKACNYLDLLEKNEGMYRWLEIFKLLLFLANDDERRLPFYVQETSHIEKRKLTPFINSLFNENIVPLKIISDELNMTSSHFCRKFKKSTGLTYVEYIHSIRINTAKKLLLQTNLYIDDICYECGFNNVSFFNRKFKKLTGMTPRTYRKLYTK